MNSVTNLDILHHMCLLSLFFLSIAFRYEDFFGATKGKGSKSRAQLLQESEDSDDKDDDMEFDKKVLHYFCIHTHTHTQP